MELISVRELFKEKEKFAGKEVTVGGWIRSVRDSKITIIWRILRK